MPVAPRHSSLPHPRRALAHGPAGRTAAAAGLCAALLAGATLRSQGDQAPATANPGAREAMWYAPTAADWAKPVQIRWQRTWQDAVALARAEQRPILVCVNMDGEIASEHYAGVRYRDPEIAKLYTPYVCVVASVFRHNPRDYDDQGRRIECPRFGGCTCGEHIALEPLVYAKFLDGQRVAPRHIMVEVGDGDAVAKKFDVYYAFDTKSVFAAIQDGIAQRSQPVRPVVRGDRSLLERVQSPDSADREAVEQAFASGSPQQQQALLAAADQLGAAAPVELLRLALHGLDPAAAAKARGLLAQSTAPGADELLGEALRAPLSSEQKQPLVAALERLGATSPRARALAVVHQGLGKPSAAVDPAAWQRALVGGGSYAAVAGAAAEPQAAADEDPLAAAETSLIALRNQPGARQRRLLRLDAEAAAARAAERDAANPRLVAVQALLAAERGAMPEAYALAERAARALPPDAGSPLAAAVLFLFAEARQEAIVAAHRQKQTWPPEWLADVHATYEVLARHPHGTAQHVGHHYDFLAWFGGADAAQAALEAGLQRFPTAAPLHERLRTSLLRQRGVDALESTYERLLQAPGADQPALSHFAGYAALVAAEHHRRRGNASAALAAYARAEQRLAAAAADPGQAASSAHFTAIACFGVARVHFENGEFDRSLAALCRGFTTCPEATPALDGLNLSGADTARMLVQKLDALGQTEALARLRAAMASLDPELLRLPDYERQGPGPAGGGGRPNRRNR
ncbi:MAG: hypothetical protein JNK49_11860 [Planctomycetes bacterium]|nr:hypothetical protein [Planctomycetota bacterium]